MKKQLGLLLLVSTLSLNVMASQFNSDLKKKTSFSEKWSRYPSPDSILNQFRVNFPLAFHQNAFISRDCAILTGQNRSTLGDSAPLTGKAAIDEPNSSFANWYLNCAAQYIVAESMALDSERQTIAELNEFYSPKVVAQCLHVPRQTSFNENATYSREDIYCSWEFMSVEIKKDLVQNLLIKYIGPDEVLMDLGIRENPGEFSQLIIGTVDAFSKKPTDQYMFLGVGPYTLEVQSATKIIKFLIHLGDALKY